MKDGSDFQATIGQLKGIIHKLLVCDAAKTTSIGLLGPPGIGKTQMVEQITEDIGARCAVYLTATMDPTDVVGVPHPDLVNNVTKFLPPEDFLLLTDEAKYKGPMVALFDDLPACREEVFTALFRMFQQREIGGRKIRDNVLLCATGNRASDRAGAAEIPTALANRIVWFNVKIDNEEWRHWAIQHNIVEEVVSFIRAKGDALHKFDPSSGFLSFPTPRSVAKASDLLQAIGTQNPVDLRLALVGCCGEGWAIQFMAFMKVRDKLIPASEVLKDPENARVPAEGDIDLMFATITSLTYHIKKNPVVKEAVAAIQYARRLPHKEMAILLARDIIMEVVMESKDVEFRAAILTSDQFCECMPEYERFLRETP